MKNSILNFAASLVIAAFCFISCDKSSNQENTFKYLAVQIDDGDNWSIVDEDGNIVVDREYSSKDKISPISNNGTYWVYSDSENKYQLYNIHSPKKPIVSTEFEQASCFINNKSFVCDGENPIQIINEEGEIIKTLSQDIHQVYIPSIHKTSNRIPFKNQTGQYGYLNEDGEVVISAKYQNITQFSEELALVKATNFSSYLDIIDPTGNIVGGKIDLNKYELIFPYSFSEGKIAVTEKTDERALVYLNSKGEIALRTNKIFLNGRSYLCGPEGSLFKDGIAVVVDQNNNACVIDEQGEYLIRPGKYSNINYIGKGNFVVSKNNRWYIINKNDDIISEELPGQILFVDNNQIGNNYILANPNRTFGIVNLKGEKILDFHKHGLSFDANTHITYIDFEHVAAELIQKIDSTGYTPLKGNIHPKEIASIFNLVPQENLRYKRYIELPLDSIDNYLVEACVNFDARTQVEKTHNETVNDGWFAYQKNVSDGWDWNNDAQLKNIYIELKHIPFYSKKSVQNLHKKIREALVKKGFIELDNSFEARNGNSYTSISINSMDEFSIYISPNRNYSEVNTDCCDIN